MEAGIKSLSERLIKLPNRIREKLAIDSDQGIAEPLYVDAQENKAEADSGDWIAEPLNVDTLEGYEVKQSMSRNGDCLDSAPIEIFLEI